MTALVAVGTWGSPEVALGGFHSKAGWVFFTIAALGGVRLAQRRGFFHRAAEGRSSVLHQREVWVNPTAAYLIPMVTVLAVGLLTGLAANGFDRLYGLRVVGAIVAIWIYRKRYPRPNLSRPWLPVGVGVAVAVVWILGSRHGLPDGPSEIAIGLGTLSPAAAALWIGVRAAGSGVTTPVVEELAFRGFLMRRFVSRDFEQVSYRSVPWIALVGSSLAFGLMHSQWVLGICAGVAYGLATMARGRLSDAVLAHATTNAGLVAWVLVTGEWSLLS